MTQRSSRRGRLSRDPGGVPATKLLAAKVTDAEHERLVALARAQGMTVSEFVRAACAGFEAKSDPEWWQGEEETRASIDAVLGPAEVRRFCDGVRAAIMADGPEGETPEQAQCRYEEWLHGS